MTETGAAAVTVLLAYVLHEMQTELLGKSASVTAQGPTHHMR
jgi:hypothetical protein